MNSISEIDPRCRVRRGSISLKRHVGPETDKRTKAKIATTAALMRGVNANRASGQERAGQL